MKISWSFVFAPSTAAGLSAAARTWWPAGPGPGRQLRAGSGRGAKQWGPVVAGTTELRVEGRRHDGPDCLPLCGRVVPDHRWSWRMALPGPGGRGRGGAFADAAA